MKTYEETNISEILGSMPNGVMTYTKGNGSGDPSGDQNILWVDFGTVSEVEVDGERHEEVIEQLQYLDPSLEGGEIGDYRVFDVTEYPEINVDQVCQQFVVVWP